VSTACSLTGKVSSRSAGQRPRSATPRPPQRRPGARPCEPRASDPLPFSREQRLCRPAAERNIFRSPTGVSSRN